MSEIKLKQNCFVTIVFQIYFRCKHCINWFTVQLLNQLDGAGPPPASKDQIDALPMTAIVQEQVGEFLTASDCIC